jgi:hypothetical protein
MLQAIGTGLDIRKVALVSHHTSFRLVGREMLKIPISSHDIFLQITSCVPIKLSDFYVATPVLWREVLSCSALQRIKKFASEIEIDKCAKRL